jgi:hypothetical protein
VAIRRTTLILLAALCAVAAFALAHGSFGGASRATGEPDDEFYPVVKAAEDAALSRIRAPAGFHAGSHCAVGPCFERTPSISVTLPRLGAWAAHSGLRLQPKLELSGVGAECSGPRHRERHLPYLTLEVCMGTAKAGNTVYLVEASSLLLLTRHGAVGTRRRLGSTDFQGTKFTVLYVGVPRPRWWQEQAR